MGVVSQTGNARVRRLAAAAAAAVLLVGLAACQSGTPAGRRTVVSSLTGKDASIPREATAPMAPAVAAADAAFRFDQILGIPTDKQDTLARAIAEDAGKRNIRLVRRTEPNAPYRVLGYLSAVGGDAGVSLTYVWDIIDAQGQRVHRFAGVENAGTADSDPWSGVDSSMLKAVAARTIEDIYTWINQLPTAPPPAAESGHPAIRTL